MGKWKENPRYHLVCTRLSDEEYARLMDVVQRINVNISDALRIIISEAGP